MIPRNRVAIVAACMLVLAPGLADDTDVLMLGGLYPNIMILFDSSQSMNDTIPGGKKIDIAKQVVTNLIANTSNVRFGVMKFANHGGAMVAPIGTSVATMVTAVNAMSLTSFGTPLGDQLYDAGRYFKGTFGSYASPIDLHCRLNVAIVVSDGLENQTNHLLVNEATLRFTQDHSALTGDQNVVVHAVGFGIDPSEAGAANDILQEAAGNGGGQFYSTNAADELQASLEALISSITAGTFGFAATAIPSTSTTGSDRAYRASFVSDAIRPFWRGHLEAFQRDASGMVPTDPDGLPLSSALVWDAGEQLDAKSASSRTIHTVVAGTQQLFQQSNGTITAALLGVTTSGERDDIIDFVRGIDAFDEDNDSNTAEPRQWKLGDILHSTPVLVTPPRMISTDPLYLAFKTAQAARTTVLLTGANDGMLHAFRETDGEELWGFIPPDLLGKLQDLTPYTGAHEYYVDSSPVAADVEIAGAYSTVVLSGERRGGRSYHLLDVTDTESPVYLWSFTDARIGETWSVPAIGRVRLSGGGTAWVAFAGGGYDTAQNNASGKTFYVIDLATGAMLWEYWADGTADDRQSMNYSIAAPPTAIDLDADGFVDRVYVGDVGGQVWKFDVSPPAVLSGGTVVNWSGKRLFAAAPGQANPPPAGAWQPAQAIYAAPAAATDDAGELWLYFGTGDLNHPLNASLNRFYGLRDDTDMVNDDVLTEASLVDVTTTDASGGNGWYIRLPADEKSFTSAEVFDGKVLFTTFKPTVAVTCTGSGTSTLYAVQQTTGYAAIDWSTGEDLDETDSSEPRSAVVGTGIPGKPALVLTITDGILEATVVTGTTNLELEDQPLDPVALRRILYWREVY
jgi:type IV pilus assembly protein PilY1